MEYSANMIKQKKKLQKGFTLIELMIVIALLSIITSLATAALGQTSHRAAIKSLSEEVAGLITQTRITAMTSGSFVSLCPVTDIDADPITCTTWTMLSAGGANNSLGWATFKDYNGDGVFDNGVDTIVNTLAFNDYGGKVGVTNDNGSTNNISYNRKGELTAGERSLTIRSRTPSYHGSGYDRNVVLAAVTGRVRNILHK